MIKIVIPSADERKTPCVACTKNSVDVKIYFSRIKYSPIELNLCDKCYEELKMQINQPITKWMIKTGLEKGIIKIVNGDLDHGTIGILCQIADNQFYFADGLSSSEMTAEEYLKITDMDEIVDLIHTELVEVFQKDFPDEYEFYYHFLKEALS